MNEFSSAMMAFFAKEAVSLLLLLAFAADVDEPSWPNAMIAQTNAIMVQSEPCNLDLSVLLLKD